LDQTGCGTVRPEGSTPHPPAAAFAKIATFRMRIRSRVRKSALVVCSCMQCLSCRGYGRYDPQSRPISLGQCTHWAFRRIRTRAAPIGNEGAYDRGRGAEQAFDLRLRLPERTLEKCSQLLVSSGSGFRNSRASAAHDVLLSKRCVLRHSMCPVAVRKALQETSSTGPPKVASRPHSAVRSHG